METEDFLSLYYQFMKKAVFMMLGQNVLRKSCGMGQLPKIILMLIFMLQERETMTKSSLGTL